MKKTTTTAYELNKANGDSDLIIGYYDQRYFVRTSDCITEYTRDEMNEVYNLSQDELDNIKYTMDLR